MHDRALEALGRAANPEVFDSLAGFVPCHRRRGFVPRALPFQDSSYLAALRRGDVTRLGNTLSPHHEVT